MGIDMHTEGAHWTLQELLLAPLLKLLLSPLSMPICTWSGLELMVLNGRIGASRLAASSLPGAAGPPWEAKGLVAGGDCAVAPWSAAARYGCWQSCCKGHWEDQIALRSNRLALKEC